MQDCRQRTGDVELRSVDDSDLKSIAGYAAVFYREDDPGTQYEFRSGDMERIDPGAFDDFKQHDVRALFNHDSNQILGRQKSGTLSLSVDDRGLRYQISPNDSQVYRDVVSAIQRGDVDGSSFQFRVLDESWGRENGRDVRTIEKVELFDVGPVVFPAYGAAESEAASNEYRCAQKTWQDREENRKFREKAEKLCRNSLIVDKTAGVYL